MCLNSLEAEHAPQRFIEFGDAYFMPANKLAKPKLAILNFIFWSSEIRSDVNTELIGFGSI